jgi:DNA-binding PadR family transcriptional regulator
MTDHESLILRLLAKNKHGLFGSELLKLGKGQLNRGSIYNVLEKLEKNSAIRIEEVPQQNGDDQRIKHIITDTGSTLLRVWSTTKEIVETSKRLKLAQ